jgi:hypothetical protein
MRGFGSGEIFYWCASRSVLRAVAGAQDWLSLMTGTLNGAFKL